MKKHNKALICAFSAALAILAAAPLAAQADELDEIVAMFSNKRAVSRIPRVNLTVLRIAIYEAMYDERVPVNVAISEAVRLTQMYALEPDVSFVNGVLGSFSKSEYVNNKEEDMQ